MKIKLLLLLFVCGLNFLSAQDQIGDKAFQELERHRQKDTVRVNLLYEYGNAIIEEDHDAGLSAIQEGIDLSVDLAWKKGEAQGLVYLISIKTNDGEFNGAANAGLQAFKIIEEIKDVNLSFDANNNMGELYRIMDNYELAETHDKKCLAIAQAQKDEYMLMTANLLLAVYYSDVHDWTMFDKYLDAGLELAIKQDDIYSQARATELSAQEAVYFKNFESARDYYMQTISLLEGTGNHSTISFMKSGLAIAYAELDNKDSALYFAGEAMEEAETYHLNKELRDAYGAYYHIYHTFQDYELALDNYLIYDSLWRKDFNMQSAKEVERSKANFDEEKRNAIAQKELERQKLIRNISFGGLAVVLIFAGIFFMQRNKIRKGKKRSDELLLNILPAEVAEELKAKGEADARLIDHVTVLFTDFKGFTAMSEQLSPKELVRDIHECFSAFDRIMEKYGIEKIKTIGDSYMAAGGLPTPNNTHAEDVVRAAFEIRDFIAAGKARKVAQGLPYFDIRIGIHSGPVVAGIVGLKKFAYDIWGDTVNTASRMESSGEIGKINISESTWYLIKHKFRCTHRGKIQAKGKGEIDMYFVDSMP